MIEAWSKLIIIGVGRKRWLRKTIRKYEKDLEIECRNWYGGKDSNCFLMRLMVSLGFIEKVLFIYIFPMFILKPSHLS